MKRTNSTTIEITKSEIEKTIFNAIDNMMDLHNEHFSPSEMVVAFLKVGIIDEAEFNRYMSYIDTKFYNWIREMKKSMN